MSSARAPTAANPVRRALAAARSELRAQVYARPWLFRLLLRVRAGRRGVAPRSDDTIAMALGAFAESANDVCFVQIGSNDGFTNDPLVRHSLSRGWRGVLVEPVPYVFRRLRERHRRNRRLRLENLAIGTRDGTVPFYYLREWEGARYAWYDQIGSFSREHLLRHAAVLPGLERHIEQAAIPCLTFDSLCRRHDLATVDLIHIDAEGHDFQILTSIDLARYRPHLVLFESAHMTGPERAHVGRWLEQRGFVTVTGGLDTLAVHRGALARWPRLRAAIGPP